MEFVHVSVHGLPGTEKKTCSLCEKIHNHHNTYYRYSPQGFRLQDSLARPSAAAILISH